MPSGAGALARLRHEIRAAGRAWRLRDRPRRVAFLLSTPRSGTWHLLELVNSLPDVDLAGEALNPSLTTGPSPLVRGPRTAITHLRAVVGAREAPVTGAKLLLNHLERLDTTVGHVADAFPDARFVVVVRRHLGEQYVSLEVAKQTGRWRARSGDAAFTGTIEIDRERFLRYCEHRRAQFSRLLAEPAVAERGLVVVHEEVRERPQEAVDTQLAPFLGVASGPVASRFVRQNRRPLSEVVANHDEVADLLERERLEHI